MNCFCCGKCAKTGFKGRMAVHEMMMMSPEIRELAFQRAPLTELRKASLNAGFPDLLGDGKLKTLDGLTTMIEVSKIAQVEGTVDH